MLDRELFSPNFHEVNKFRAINRVFFIPGLPVSFAATLFAGLLFPAFSLFAQVEVKNTRPNYTDRRDGGVSDRRTRFLWRKCVYGQSYRAGVCRGKGERVSYRQARRICRDSRFLNYRWRLPGAKEMEYIAEPELARPQSGRPALNSRYFQGSEPHSYWSRTVQRTMKGTQEPWVYSFKHAYRYVARRSERHLVRCVSDTWKARRKRPHTRARPSVPRRY